MLSETIVLPKKITGEENRFLVQLKTQLLKQVKEINRLQRTEGGDSDLSDYYTKEEVDDIVNTKLAELVSSAPEALDTLEELAEALGDDPNFATTVATQIGNKLDKTSPNYIKNISINGTTVTITKGDDTTSTETTQDTVPFVPTKVSQLTNDSGYITGVSWDDVISKPSTFPPSTHTHPQYLTSVSWSQVTSKPTFATVATSGSYTDLSNKPTIPTVPTNVSSFTNDAGYITGVAWGDITGKPTTFTPSSHTHNYAGSSSAGGSATSVNTTSATANRARHVWFSYNNTDHHGEMCYNDNLQYNPSTNVLTVGSITGSAGSVAWGDVSGKPAFSTVATSGSYADLSNKPTIPTMPTISTGSTNGTISVNGSNVSVNGSPFITTSGNQVVDGRISYRNNSVTRGTLLSSSATVKDFCFLDKNDSYISYLFSYAYSDGRNNFCIRSYKWQESAAWAQIVVGIPLSGDPYFQPNSDNTTLLGNSSNRWKQLYAATTTIATSDERLKDNIESIPDNVLDAWGEIQWCQYQFKDSIKEKGNDARIHTGAIAQRIEATFEKHGIDPFKYGLLCYDEWDKLDEIKDEDGNIIEYELPSGNRYSLRYEEALCMEAAYQRRRADKLEERIRRLEERL